MTLLGCELGAHIAPAGFDDWSKPLAHSTARFEEYGSYGPGARGPRAAFARQLDPSEAEGITLECFWRSME